ncbi:hypothetical protein DENSPDRAFT_700064 [Dentipellis sp. KUC8613]|nr:hypothetical protein DENSPDRAFT_700064 [Dentipellis sp. KUC8613]
MLKAAFRRYINFQVKGTSRIAIERVSRRSSGYLLSLLGSHCQQPHPRHRKLKDCRQCLGFSSSRSQPCSCVNHNQHGSRTRAPSFIRVLTQNGVISANIMGWKILRLADGRRGGEIFLVTADTSRFDKTAQVILANPGTGVCLPRA